MSTSYQQQSKNARSNILAKLKQQVAGADYTQLPKETGYNYPELSTEQQVTQFVSLLEANHAQVIKLDISEIPAQVSQALLQRGISSLLYGTDTDHCAQMSQLDSSIKTQVFDFSLSNNKERLFNETPASITSSHSAIAATGSIVLWPTITEPRSLSLVPPLHIVIVDANTLHSNFASLISAQQWTDKLPTNVVLVSGPSKTADIQQTLAYGAHGPKEMIVLLLNA